MTALEPDQKIDLWRFTSSDFKRWWLNGVN